ncbi:MAG: DUF411 domain-containing protein, partial [Wenzhouxiangella sp.]
ASNETPHAGSSPAEPVAAAVDAADDGAQPDMIVHKTPWCGCCTAWAEQARAAGFEVELRDHDHLNDIKHDLGVPPAGASCHTAQIGGYFIEGHVPFADIRRLLDERPQARGLTVPGMPIGSPGMEQGDVRQAFDVLLVDDQGATSVYNHYPERGL